MPVPFPVLLRRAALALAPALALGTACAAAAQVRSSAASPDGARVAQSAPAPAPAPERGTSAGRAPAPRPADSREARLLACTGCHGAQGRATPDGYYPRIAGKPAGYLYNQLLNFRDGRRFVPSMTWMVDGLPESYLREIAAHFADLHLPYAPPPPPAVPADALERGRRLALEGDASRDLPACIACHGDALLGAQPAVPGLLGLPRDYLNAQFGAWREGTRRAMAPDCMATIARRLAGADVAAVTAWLASRPVPTQARPAETLPAKLPIECGGLGR